MRVESLSDLYMKARMLIKTYVSRFTRDPEGLIPYVYKELGLNRDNMYALFRIYDSDVEEFAAKSFERFADKVAERSKPRVVRRRKRKPKPPKPRSVNKRKGSTYEREHDILARVSSENGVSISISRFDVQSFLKIYATDWGRLEHVWDRKAVDILKEKLGKAMHGFGPEMHDEDVVIEGNGIRFDLEPYGKKGMDYRIKRLSSEKA